MLGLGLDFRVRVSESFWSATVVS